MFDHLSLSVSDLQRSIAFYDAALPPLKFDRCFALPHTAAYGKPQRPMFWLYQNPEAAAPLSGFHLAFEATTRQAVDEFYEAAIVQGGTDNGKPGLRTQYHPNYYAAFAIDLDGYRIEAVCHQTA